MAIQSRYAVEIPQKTLPSWLFGSATATLSNNPLFIDPKNPTSRHVSMLQYRSWSMRVARGLLKAGIRAGDRVMYSSINQLSIPCIFMGTIMAGAVITPTDPMRATDAFSANIQDVQPKLIFVPASAAENTLAAASAAAYPQDQVILLDEAPLFGEVHETYGSLRHWSQFLGDPEQVQPFDWTALCTDIHALAVMVFTTGSTGRPKAVMMSHYNLVANSTQYIHLMQQDPLEPQKRIKWVGWLPMYGVFGMTQFMLTGPKRGITNYLMRRWDLELLVRNIEFFKPTELFMAPPLAKLLASTPGIHQRELSSIRSVILGGAPMLQAHFDLFASFLHQRPLSIANGLGITEFTCVALFHRPQDSVTWTTSVGELMPNCEGKVMSILDGVTELGAGQEGEVWLRGPTTSQGYWQRPDKTAEAFTADRWLKTGDFGYYDVDGKWFVSERINEIIISNTGVKLPPTEVEALLFASPAIADAGVVSIKENPGNLHTIPRIFVVPAPGHNVSQDDVRSIVKARFDQSFDFSREVILIDAIPRRLVGKVDRPALRQMLSGSQI